MNKKYHFIAGLPRSGSTLLTTIFNQNPLFHSNVSDTLLYCVEGVINNLTSKHAPVSVKEENAKRMILGLIDGHYFDVDKPVIFNANRGWTKHIEYLYRLNPNFKLICPVRNYNEILNSFEKNYKSRRLIDPVDTVIYNGMTANVWTRTNYIGNDGFVRISYNFLMEAYYGPYKNHLLLVEYENLVKHPEETVKKIYDFIEEPYFNHDFENVNYSNEAYDDKLFAPNLHKIEGKVEPKNTEVVLPPDLWNGYSNMEFWRQ
jgi:sulfotransferase